MRKCIRQDKGTARLAVDFAKERLRTFMHVGTFESMREQLSAFSTKMGIDIDDKAYSSNKQHAFSYDSEPDDGSKVPLLPISLFGLLWKRLGPCSCSSSCACVSGTFPGACSVDAGQRWGCGKVLVVLLWRDSMQHRGRRQCVFTIGRGAGTRSSEQTQKRCPQTPRPALYADPCTHSRSSSKTHRTAPPARADHIQNILRIRGHRSQRFPRDFLVQGEEGEFLDETLPQTIPEIQKEMQAVNKQAKGVREVMQRADWNASSPEGLNVTAQQEELIDLRERLQQQLLHAKAGRKIVNRLQATGHARQLVPDEDHIMSARLRGLVATAADQLSHGFMHTARRVCIQHRLQMHSGLAFLAELQ